MRKTDLRVALLALLATACMRPAVSDRAPESTVGLSVRILDRLTGSGIGGATLWMRFSEAALSTGRQFVTTDTSGVIRVSDLPTGRYALRAWSLGYLSRDTLLNVDQRLTQPVVIRLERDTLSLR